VASTEEAVAKEVVLLSVPRTQRGVGPTAMDLRIPGHVCLWVQGSAGSGPNSATTALSYGALW
jgi:hypothetical protein